MIIKTKKPRRQEIEEAKCFQLKEIRRNLQSIDGMTEFGAKISISDDDGFVDVDRISWIKYNEANDMIEGAEKYKKERRYD